MLFKDMKPGYPVYMLNKESVKTVTGKVVNVSQPRFANQLSANGNFQATAQLYVDVTLEVDGQTKTYSIPDTLSVTYAGDIVLSVDRDGILRDVEAMKSQSEEALRDVDKHKATVASCEKILEEWNPVFAEKKRQDERICGLENEVKGLGTMLRDFINEFKK